MKFNKWTTGLAAVGVVSLASAARADETKMSQVQTALSNTTLSGYVDTSAMWNTGTQDGAPHTSPAGTHHGGYLPPYTPGMTHGDGFNLNAVDIALDKPLDESPWAAGYHVETMFGQDAVGETLSSNVGSGTSATYASTIRQAYLALRTPIGNSAIDWKFGLWDSPIGYESSSSPLNPNFTRSYGWFIEPTTFTGALGTFKATDWISFSGGVANATQGNATDGQYPTPSGQNNPYESQKAYLGSVTLTAPDSWGWMKGATLTGGVIVADNGSAASSANGATWLYVGSVIPTPLDKLKVGLAFDYKDYHNATDNNAGNNDNDSIWVAGAYLSYQATDKLSLNVRAENYGAESAGASTGVPAEGHNVQELTGTLEYKLWENVLSRLEVRWDHAPSKAWDNSHDGSFPYGPIHENEVLLAANLVYQF
jgi:hypothetical protein